MTEPTLIEKSTCLTCGSRCCRYVALELDEPTRKRDYDHIRWYLMHRDVNVFTGHDGAWHLEFETACEMLGSAGECTGYKRRPRICESHGKDHDCEFVAESEPHELHFSTAGQFEQYLDENGIKWRKKRQL